MYMYIALPATITHVYFPGNIIIPTGVIFTVDFDLNGASPQFTLTCISTGGPATTVTWTRDSDTVKPQWLRNSLQHNNM